MFEGWDATFLARLQFAFTIMFHYLFPPLTIGMGVVLVYLSWNRWRGGDAAYDAAARFWTRIYALDFAVGVASLPLGAAVEVDAIFEIRS